MKQGLDEYTSKQKENWRGWQWNRIVEKLCGPRNLGPAGIRNVLKDKTVLYLCGPDAFDREVALSHGFDDCNLIAVDTNADCIANVRRDGGLGITCTLGELLINWPADWKIDAVVADFCCGFEDASQGLPFALWRSPGIQAHTDTMPVVAVNLQRGRDNINESNHKFRASVADCMRPVVTSAFRFKGPEFKPDGSWNVEPKNRAGFILDWIHAQFMMHSRGVYVLPHPNDPEKELTTWPSGVDADPVTGIALWAMSRIALGACFRSYRSRKVVMDSVVFSLPPRPADTGDGFVDLETRALSLDYMLKDDFYYGSQLISDNIKGLIAALRAVRTKRMRDGNG